MKLFFLCVAIHILDLKLLLLLWKIKYDHCKVGNLNIPWNPPQLRRKPVVDFRVRKVCYLRWWTHNYTGGHVEHAGCTVFRFPLRQPEVKSQICDMSFSPPDVQAMEVVFQSVDFRMFLHSTLLFTKHLNQVKVCNTRSTGHTMH